MSATATATEPTAKQQAKGGRDARGRFAPGNPGGPGNPFARKVAELRSALVNFVTVDDMKHIAFVIKMRAEGGDMAAAKLLFQYVLGKPAETVDPDRLAVDEWQKMREQARPAEEMSQVMNSVPAQKACDVTKVTWPCAFETNFAEPLRASFEEMDTRDAQSAAAKGEGKVKAAPTPNGENGGSGNRGVAPIPNGENGEEEDWLLRLARETMAERPSPKGQNGSKARRKAKRRR